MKSFSRRWYVKLTAYVLILLCLAGSVIISLQAADTLGEDGMASLGSKYFMDSSECAYELSRMLNNLLVMQYEYQNREHVESGGAVDEDELYGQIHETNAYREFLQQNELSSGTEVYYDGYTGEPMLANQESVSATTKKAEQWRQVDQGGLGLYVDAYPEVLEEAREGIIERQLKNYDRIVAYLKSMEGKFQYYIYQSEANRAQGSLTPDNMDGHQLYFQYNAAENAFVVVKRNAEVEHIANGKGYVASGYYLEDHYDVGTGDVIVVAMDNQYLESREAAWSQDHKIALRFTVLVILCLAAALGLFLYLCAVTGRQPDKKEIQLCTIDRMFSEIHIILLCCLTALFFEALRSTYYFQRAMDGAPIAISGVLLVAAAGMVLVLSLLRSIKARRFFRSFAIGRICIRFAAFWKRLIKGIWEGGSLMARGILVAVAIPLLSTLWVTVPFLIVALIWAVSRTVTRLQRIQVGVQAVKAGDLQYKIDVQGGDLGALAEDINTLSEGLENAISSEVRAERLKTELISNVSHDIKTPLTSIVTYVDLLRGELEKASLDREKLQEYAGVLEQKTSRLRVLTTDLFEAAKATSGAMTVNLEQVDVAALVRQGLGEYDDRLREAGLDLRVHMPDEATYIYADGRLVWRIFENMLSNVIKYALAGSRVYIDVTRGHGHVMLTMKNISAYELNVPANELMERFKRGDESRSSEGSGLGLSIATSLAKLQHGVFAIEVDGDLFKAILTMPEYQRVMLEKK